MPDFTTIRTIDTALELQTFKSQETYQVLEKHASNNAVLQSVFSEFNDSADDMNALATELSQSEVIQARLKNRLTYPTKSGMDAAGAPPNAGTDLSELAEVYNDRSNNGIYGWDNTGLKWETVSLYEWVASQYLLAISTAVERLAALSSTSAAYDTAQDNMPLITDTQGKMLLYYSKITNSLEGEILSRFESAISKSTSLSEYGHDGDYAPLLVEPSGAILHGWNTRTNRAVHRHSGSVGHKIMYGQSLSVGATSVPVLSGSQRWDNLSFASGPRGAGLDYSEYGLLREDTLTAPDGGGNRGETPLSAFLDYITMQDMRHSGQKTVSFGSAPGNGGFTLAQLGRGTAPYNRLLDHVTGAKSLISDSYAGVDCIAWVQGENDAVIPTSYNAYKAALITLFDDLQADIKAITGQANDVIFLLAQTSYYSASTSEIVKAQLDVCNEYLNAYFVTPTYPLEHGVSDEVHLSNYGSANMGALFGQAFRRAKRGMPTGITPVSAEYTAASKTIEVQFNVPVLPLRFESGVYSALEDYGFTIKDANDNLLSIDSVTADGSSVSIVLDAAAPSGDIKIRYALDNNLPEVWFANCAVGSLFDSNQNVYETGSRDLSMRSYCPHFELIASNN